MSTKINTDYYGLESTWGAPSNYGIAAKYSASSFGNLVSTGKWDITNNANLDSSIIPWGIPQCSVTSMAYTLYLRKNYVSPNYYGDFYPVIHESEKKNTPIMFAGSNTTQSWYKRSYVSGASTTDARNLQKLRIEGAVKYDSGFKYTNTCDVDTTYTAEAGRLGRPITYCDYQKTKLFIGSARLIDKNQITAGPTTVSKGYTALMTETPAAGTDFVCVGINSNVAYNNTVMTNYAAVLSAQKYKAPPHLTHRYFDDLDQEFLQTNRNICCVGYDTNVPNVTNSFQRYENIYDNDTKTASFPCQNITTQFMNVSSKKQIFTDVSYHWELRVRYATGSGVFWLNEGDRLPGTDADVPAMQCVPILIIDDTIYDNYFKSVAAAMLHEFAFIGIPMITDENDITENIGSNKVFLPVFDTVHMITTGEYKSGSESLALPNATWNDIFDDNIPDWDSEYVPPEPVPDEGDSGDLSNAGNYLHRFGAEGLTIWAFYRTSLGGNGLDAAINAITDLYLTDPDGNEKWQLDFKGTNPDEYIVSLMAFPLRFSLSESTYTFKLGAVDFEGIDVKKYADTGFFTFGSVTVPAYGDFRDFAPYTTAELYIPFCGTCDINMAFFAGRDLIVDMYYDIYTGSCAAAIYRYTALGKTLYKTINGQIGVEIPLSAARMGDYQNTLHSLETAQKQNDIRIATSVLGMGITAGATIATGGATLPLLAAGVASTMGVVSSVQKSDEINYQLEHTQPKPTQTTAASTQNNYCVGGTRCMLFIKRAHMDSGYNADVYGRTKGYACLLNNTVNDNSGLTVCSNIDTSNIPATADEINAIKQAFANGVIL